MGARGAHILFTDIDQRVIDKTVKKFRDEGLKVDGYLCRSSDEGEVVSFFEKVSKDFGAPDILVNNAAAAIHIPPQDTSLQEWDRVIGASLTGYFLNAREFYRRSHAAGKPGVIVNIASIVGSSAIGRGNFAYSVAKGGVIQMTRELAVEWAASKIRVNAIQSCSVNTPGWRSWDESEGDAGQTLMQKLLSGIPLGRVAEPQDIAHAVLFLASDASAMITGVMLPVDGGNLALNAGGTLGISVAPVRPVQPTEPVKPAAPVKPVDPKKPIAPEKPHK